MARSTAQAAGGGEGDSHDIVTTLPAAAGAAVGSDRQGVYIRDRQGRRLSGRPLPRALTAPRLSFHVWA